MIVGPTGGGKTVVIETLCDAQTLLGNPTNLYILNPKACTVIELYGELDPATRDWTDGLLSNIFREVNKPLSDDRANEKKYILFDGDVDALWIENMNSVMDDNKILTLANQERIKLQDHCKLLFEVNFPYLFKRFRFFKEKFMSRLVTCNTHPRLPYLEREWSTSIQRIFSTSLSWISG